MSVSNESIEVVRPASYARAHDPDRGVHPPPVPRRGGGTQGRRRLGGADCGRSERRHRTLRWHGFRQIGARPPRAVGEISEPVPQHLHVGIAARAGRSEAGQPRRRSVHRRPWREQEPARYPRELHESRQSSRVPRTTRVRSRHVGRRRSPRSSALTAWTDKPAIVASSSCVKPAASRSPLSWAPNERGAPALMTSSSYR
jgi:hypothetical protein